jgi:hypothetical protein
LLLDTEEKIRAVYGPIKADGHRHNATNVSIVVNKSATKAQVTAYFVTTMAWEIRAEFTKLLLCLMTTEHGKPSIGLFPANGAGAWPMQV